MAPPIIFNSNSYINMESSEERMKASETTQKGNKRRDACPGNEFLDTLWFQDADVPSSRVSVATRTSLGLWRSVPNIHSKRMGEAFSAATGHCAAAFKQEIDELVRVAVRNEMLTNGVNRTVSVRRSDQGYKLLVSVESRNDERRAWWSRKDTLAVCATLISLRDKRWRMDAEKGDEEVPLMISYGKVCVVRVGPLGIRWAVDLDKFGGRQQTGLEKKGVFKRLKCGSEDEDDELESLILH